MNCKTILVALSVLSIYGTTTFAQNRTYLQGNAVSETGEKIDFYSLILQSATDSSVVAAEMFYDTVFRFSGLKSQTYILRLNDLRYQSYDTAVTVVEGANTLNFPLVLKPATLGEVVVKGSRPVIVNNRGDLTVDVANSYLKNDISLSNILGKLPGVIVDDNGEISMFGKDRILIRLNNMKIHSAEELKSLQPADIDRIEIIRGAGAEYDADIDAVIIIKTRRKRNERIFVSLNEELELNHYTSNGVNLSLYAGISERLSQYFTFGNSAIRSRGHSCSHIRTYLGDNMNRNFRDDYPVWKIHGNNLFYSLNLAISKKDDMGVQYSGFFGNNVKERTGTRLIYHDEALKKTVNLHGVEKAEPHSSTVNLNYKRKINDAAELSVIADYLIKNTRATADITESSSDGSANTFIDSY
jgi:hypothetical protein